MARKIWGVTLYKATTFAKKEIVSTSNIAFTKNDGIFEMLKWKNDAKISNDADLIYKQGGTMAYIKKKSERKFKITVCNGYKVNGQKRMKTQTITVPSSVPKRGIQQYVMAEAERIEKKFKYGVEESNQTRPTLNSTPKTGSSGRNRFSKLPPMQGTNAIWILSTH